MLAGEQRRASISQLHLSARTVKLELDWAVRRPLVTSVDCACSGFRALKGCSTSTCDGRKSDTPPIGWPGISTTTSLKEMEDWLFIRISL